MARRHHHEHVLPALALLTLSAAASAQSSVFFPPEYERAFGRGSTALLGGNSTRTQLIYAQPFAPGTVVLGIRFRPTTAILDRAAFTADMAIRCSSGPLVPGALSSTFANNVGSDETVVLPQQTVNIPAFPANRGTGQLAEVLFATPFIYGLNGNTNLVVDIQVFSRSAGANWSTDRAFASTNGRAATHGIGCGAATINSTSTGGTYVAGSTVDITLAGAPANSIALLLPTVDMKEFAPGALLPLDLSLIGMAPGCTLLVNPVAGLFGVPIDVNGAASFSLPIPGSFTQAGLGFQWMYLVPPTVTNPLGFEITASRTVWIGPEVCTPFYQYVWDLSNANATTGSSTTNSIPVAELIIQ
ncbi:MAG: hypothetical protein K8J09_18930 [Planctomycetes bacterium]|nr:hypothetical protein [Planctomycetota bacterium]MCC7399561.1 hypothetical protein [Planctomycetota bacterium]